MVTQVLCTGRHELKCHCGAGKSLNRSQANLKRAVWALLLTLFVFPRLAGAQTSGSLTVTANVQGSIGLVFDNNVNVGLAGFCPLSNAGTNNAGLDLGTASFAQGDNLACVNFSRPVPFYNVSSAFDVVVTKANTASASYRLAVAMSTVPPPNVTWLMNALTMTTAAQTLQAANPYGRTTETLRVQVRNSVPAQVLVEVITFTATAN